MVKRKQAAPAPEDDAELSLSSSSDESEDEPDPEPAPKRARRPSKKQDQLDKDKAAKDQSELEKLKKALKRTQKELKKQRKAEQDRLDEINNDPDRFPPESEEEDTVSTVNLRASVRMRSSTPARRPLTTATPRIQRREHESAPPEVNLAPDRARAARSTTALSSPSPLSSSVPPLPVRPSNVDQSVSRLTSSPSPSSAQAASSGEATTANAAPMQAEASSESIASPAPTTRAATTNPNLNPAAANAGTGLIAAPFRDGTEPNGRPNASDYIDEVKDLLVEAISHFYTYIYTVNAFPDPTEQRSFAEKAWNAACSARKVPVRWAVSNRMLRAIGARKSTARGDVSDALRPRTAAAYSLRDGVISTAAKRQNINTVEKLIEAGTFHHKSYNLDAGTKTGMFENKFIGCAIQLAFFNNVRSGAGFLASDVFNPIPILTIAFILTIINAHLLEWSTGSYLKEDFSESRNGKYYKAFIADLDKYFGTNQLASSNIRKRMYTKAFRAGGGVTLDVHTSRISNVAMEAAQAELQGRTGLTDSENEDEE